ncbi:MAG: anti-sigma regulatory factor [Euryarchaeota archaeon]|nr:anti-sigma regulatory factor [Euryarchaeota archaeon]
MTDEVCIRIKADIDIMSARHASRTMAAEMGFSNLEMTLIATAISELTRNILQYAGHGEISICKVQQGNRKGMKVVVMDEGPGIPDIETAMHDGYSTSKGLGLGLPGSKRLMDEFSIVSKVGIGTTITMYKWVSNKGSGGEEW